MVMAKERIAVLIMLKSHADSGHKSVDITHSISRQYCWIVGGRRLAKTVCKFCVRCRYLRKKFEMQKMAPLPKELGVPCPAFTNVGLDLAGPFVVQSMLKKKNTRAGTGKLKVWAVLVVCLNTRALKVYTAPGYSTEDFMIAWKNFESECGIPRRVHSDRGSQLVSAAEGIEQPSYNWETIAGASGGQTTWKFCPSAAQWRNGATEAFVKKFKRSLEIFIKSGLNYAELDSMFRKVASTLNSRPIAARYGPKHSGSDPDYIEAITPNMLLTGRSGTDLPNREYLDEDLPSKRLAYRLEAERTWWKQWEVLCFDSLLTTKSWTEAKRGVKVGDVVLIGYPDKSKVGTFRLGIVVQIEKDKDNLIRTCVVGYRLIQKDLPIDQLRLYFKGIKWKKLRVPVQRLCLILPVEEYDIPEFLVKEIKETGGNTEIGGSDTCTEMMENAKKLNDGMTLDAEIIEDDTRRLNTAETLDVADMEFKDEKSLDVRNQLIRDFQSGEKCFRDAYCPSRSVKLMHQNCSMFKLIWCGLKVKEFDENLFTGL